MLMIFSYYVLLVLFIFIVQTLKQKNASVGRYLQKMENLYYSKRVLFS